MIKENDHTGKPKYQFKFSYFRRGPPIKNYIYYNPGISSLFLRYHLHKSHPPELHQNSQIKDAIFHPIFSSFILDSLSYTQTLIISTFLNKIINRSTYGFIPKRPFLRSIVVCLISLHINLKIHTVTLRTVNPPKKYISNFQDMRVGGLVLNSSNFSTNCCNQLKLLYLSLAIISYVPE